MLQPVNYGLEADPTARAAAAVEASAAEPRKHITVANALALALNMPDMALVTHRDHFSPTPGRLLDESGLTIAANWQTWMREQVDLANGDAVAVWERYREKAWTTTEWQPNVLYFSGQTGGRAWDFLQVEVRAQQEFTSKRLFSPQSWYKPSDKEELLGGGCAGPAVPNPVALGAVRYRLQEVVDFSRFVDAGTRLYSELSTLSANRIVTLTSDDGVVQTGRQRDLIPQAQPQTWNGFRWFNDWAFSSAGRSGGVVWRNWAFQTSCTEFRGGPLLSLVPVWSHSSKIARIEGRKLNDHELYGRLLKLCERTGNIPFHYFFYGLHGNIVKSASLERVLKMAERGDILLPEHDYQVLKSWEQIQYWF